MRKLLATVATVLAVTLCAPAFATPANARVFCMNRNTGQFLYWGNCRPAHAVCNYYGPGGYCRRVAYRAFYY